MIGIKNHLRNAWVFGWHYSIRNSQEVIILMASQPTYSTPKCHHLPAKSGLIKVIYHHMVLWGGLNTVNPCFWRGLTGYVGGGGEDEATMWENDGFLPDSSSLASPLQTGTQCPENPRIPPPMPSKKRPYVGQLSTVVPLIEGLMKGLFPRGGWHSLRGVPWNSYETIASAFPVPWLWFFQRIPIGQAHNQSGFFSGCVYWKKPTQTNSKIFKRKKMVFFFWFLDARRWINSLAVAS